MFRVLDFTSTSKIKGLSVNDIHANIVATLADDTSGLSKLQKWAAGFRRRIMMMMMVMRRRRRESLEVDPRSGRPAIATAGGNNSDE